MSAIVDAHPEWGAKEATQPPVAQSVTAAPAATIGFWKIAFAVMVGNLMFGVVGAIVYGLSQLK